MYNYLPTDEAHIRIIGRTAGKEPLALFWTASGIRFDTDATECYADIECDYSSHEIYIRIEIDGFLFQRFMVPVGRRRFCLFKNLPSGELKSVSVLLEGQPIGDDPVRRFIIHGIESDLVLQPVVPAECKIEFIGDSLTSGEGLTGTDNISEWCTGIYGLTGHYALNIARYFDAEYSIVSQSGWGVYTGWDNNMNSNMPRVYGEVCGPLEGRMNEELGVHRAWDFESWCPDLVIVNLGTNDAAALNSPAWIAPKTGMSHKMQADEDGAPDTVSRDNFMSAVYDFLTDIRAANPDAYILWVYGMCGYVMEPYIKETISRFATDTHDDKVSYFSLIECPEDELAAHFHPGASNHTQNAQVIIREIERLGVLNT